jgi:hypothetical protein
MLTISLDQMAPDEDTYREVVSSPLPPTHSGKVPDKEQPSSERSDDSGWDVVGSDEANEADPQPAAQPADQSQQPSSPAANAEGAIEKQAVAEPGQNEAGKCLSEEPDTENVSSEKETKTAANSDDNNEKEDLKTTFSEAQQLAKKKRKTAKGKNGKDTQKAGRSPVGTMKGSR